jgi:predicted phosphodiesterase
MRALVLSDIHGSLEGLSAVLDAAGAVDAVWNLGDVVGYGGSPNQVVERIRPLAEIHVRGNHDRVCSGVSSPLGFNPVARTAALWTREELTEANRNWLYNLPCGPLKPSCGGVSCVHGSPLHEDHYILSMRDAWTPLQQAVNGVTFFGHTHVQGGFWQREHEWFEVRPRFRTTGQAEQWTLPLPRGTRHLINPGSAGQPRDGDWRAAFAIYETDDAAMEPDEPVEPSYAGTPLRSVEATVTFHRIPYDVTTAQGRILMAGLPERLASRLREGR